MTFLFRSPMRVPLAALVLLVGGCSSEAPERLPHPHELIAATPGDEVTFGASDDRGPYARVTVRRGDEQPGAGGTPGARYVAAYLRYEIIASREDMIVGQNNLYLFQPTLDRGFHPVGSGVVDREPQLPALQMPFVEGEIIEGWLMVEVTEERLDSDLYIAFADAGPFTADRCCTAGPPQSVAETDALILFHRSGAP